MSNITNLLTESNGFSQYPRDFEARDDDKNIVRWQRIIGPGRFVMLLRHTGGHYCGYVNIAPTDGLRFMYDQFDGIEATYEGPGTRDISWRWYNGNRKLVSAGKVSEAESDYWVGFHLQDRPDCSFNDAVSTLLRFEAAIRAALDDGEASA